MNFSQRPGSPRPGACLAVLRRRWAIVLDLAALGLSAAAVYVTAVPQVFTATAFVAGVVRPSRGIVLLPFQIPSPYDGAPPVRSDSVARIAGQMLHSSLSPLTLSKQITVTARPNSEMLDITCRAPTASGAAACANAFAAAYLKERSVSATAAINQQVARLKGDIRTLQQAVARLTTKINGLPSNSAERAPARAQLASDQDQLNTLNGQLAGLRGESAQINGGAVVARAQPPDKPSGPDKTRVLPGGLAAGLLLGLIAALLVDRRDRWMYGDGEAEPIVSDLLTGSREGRLHRSKWPVTRWRRSRQWGSACHLISAACP